MKKAAHIFVMLSALMSFSCYGQDQHLIDSVLQLLKTDGPDTTKLKHLNIVASEYSWLYASDSAMYFANASLDLSSKLLQANPNPKTERKIYSLRAGTYNTIGNVNYDKGNYPEALKSHYTALRIREKINDKAGKAPSYNNLGLVYCYQGNYTEALKNYRECLKIYTELGDKLGIASTYNNLAIVYSDQGNIEEALKNDFASLKIKEELNDTAGIAASHNNIGVSYYAAGKYDQALEHQLIAMKIHEGIKEKGGLALNFYNIGNIYRQQKKYPESEKYYNRSLELSQETGATHNIRDTYQGLMNLSEARGDYKAAFDNLKKYALYGDSLDNEESRTQTLQAEMNYDYEKKQAVAEVEHKKDLENQQLLAGEKSRKQKIILFFVASSLVLLIIFSGFIFRSLRITRKRKNIIEQQKALVEEQTKEVEMQKLLAEKKQKEVIDSINYAKRIQYSQLPSEKYIDKHLKRLMN